MKSFIDLVKIRFSVRAYSKKTVEKEKIKRCLEAARLAPSACNAQPWHFIVADKPELVKSLAEKALLAFSKMNRFAVQAPVIVAVIGEKPNATSQIGSVMKNKPLYLIDLGIAAEHFSLQAVEEGLGSCLPGWYDEKAVRKLLNVPKRKRVFLLITLGYPGNSEIPEKRRKDFDSIVSWNGY
jgi:nitroreductase